MALVKNAAPKFCRSCAAELVSGEKSIDLGFDADTGKKKTRKVSTLTCPKRVDERVSIHDRAEKNSDNATYEWEYWDTEDPPN